MRPFAALLACALWLSTPVPALAQGAGPAQRAVTATRTPASTPAPASISGVVVTASGRPLNNASVRARNVLTGGIANSASTSATGQFSLVWLEAGTYVLEVVDGAGQVIGTSPFLFAAAGATLSTTVAATSGVASAANTVTGFAATLTSTAAESVRYAAAAAGVAGLVAPVDVATASPSR